MTCRALCDPGKKQAVDKEPRAGFYHLCGIGVTTTLSEALRLCIQKVSGAQTKSTKMLYKHVLFYNVNNSRMAFEQIYIIF